MTIMKMEKLKVSELFYSLQGEGKYTGVPSVFLRTFGCNFTCSGFGLPKGQLSAERQKVDPTQYEKYEDLPLVPTGCDSYPAWDPRFKHLSPLLDIDKVAHRIVDLLPNKTWGDVHLVITGGEPLLGWQRAYPDLLSHPLMKDLTALTFETNGTQKLSQELKECLYPRGGKWATFSVSPKLSCSGEPRNEAIKPAVVCEYEEFGSTYLKFVVATDDDVEEALGTIDLYRAEGFAGAIYLMPAGGVEEVFKLNNKRVAELALKYGIRYSDRLQVSLWRNAWAT